MSTADHPVMAQVKASSEFVRAWLLARVDVRSERGASLVEYALLLALIAVVCIVAVTSLGNGLRDNYDESRTSIFGS
jgi:pilus assembly protein Flp/PilA